MNPTRYRGAANRICAFLAVAIFCMAAGNSARAQYQSIFGDVGGDAGTGGVVQASDGNFVAVGWTTSFSNNSDVYVVKSDLCGNQIWARTYDMGAQDEGHKIRLTNDGGFIIAGTADQWGGCCIHEEGWSASEAFLLRIDKDGNVKWAKTYGGAHYDHLHDVQLVPGGDGFYVAGRTASFGAGKYDGWIMEVSSTGGVVWSRTYGEWSRDGLYSLAVGDDGTLIAVGETVSYSSPSGHPQDIFVVKVGAVTGDVIWAARYRTSTFAYARSIVLDQRKGYDPVFYVAGHVDHPAATGYDAYILKGKYSNGSAITDVAFHHQIASSNTDVFNEIQILPTGNLIAVGHLGPASTLPDHDNDVYLAEVDPNLTPIWHMAYGGKYHDEGWSVAVGFPSLRYTLMVLGFTNSFSPADIDLYEIYASSAGISGCNERRPAIDKFQPGLVTTIIDIKVGNVWVECPAKVEPVVRKPYEVLCTACDYFLDDPDGGEELGGEHNSKGSETLRAAAVEFGGK